MSYLFKLRQLVGNIPLINVGSTVLVFNEKKELLLNLRSDTKTWGLPGGSMELSETVEETAKRELLEETGLTVNELELLNVFSGEEFYFKYPNGDEVYTVICLFIAKTVIGELGALDDESIELMYFGLEKLPILESRAARIIEWIKSSKLIEKI